VHLLATSREPLLVPGETVRRVPPLSLPDAASQVLAESEALRLFVERANAIAPELTLTKQNSPAVSSICRRLDGMPLAIELAPRVSMYCQLIRSRRVWTIVSDYRPPAVAWACRDTRRCRLSVFAGGWSLEAAEKVCATGPLTPTDILELLSGLVNKSLVVVDAHTATPRYRLLETMRQYAAEKLHDVGRTSAMRKRHLEWSMSLAAEGEVSLTGGLQREWLECLEREHDNVRAALEWSLVSDVEAGVAPAGSLWRFWWMHGYLDEGRAHLAKLLASSPPSASRARAKPSTLPVCLRCGRVILDLPVPIFSAAWR
jgi:predicted ATPase